MAQQQQKELGTKVIDISELLNSFEANEGEVQQITGKTGNGKTYHSTWRALNDLNKGMVVYTSWKLLLPDEYDERKDPKALFWKTIFFRKRFYSFPLKKNWHYIDVSRPDLAEYIASLTDCIIYLDEGQDTFDSRGRISKTSRQSITRSRHLKKTLVIISQRAQAVDVTARANVTFFFKCVKTRAWFWPFIPYFKVYRTEELDNENYPIWEEAELFYAHFANKKVYNAYNSWYLRDGIPKSQEIYFDAYDLTTKEKIVAFWRSLFKKEDEV